MRFSNKRCEVASAIISRSSDATSHGPAVSEGGQNICTFNLLQNFLCRVHCPLEGRSRQNDAELITATAEYKVRISNGLLEYVCDLRQNLVSHHMAKCVVDELETVDIDHVQGQRRRVSIRPGSFSSQHFLKKTGVIDSCQRIGDGGPLQLRKESGVFESYRRKVRQCRSCCHVVIGKDLQVGSE